MRLVKKVFILATYVFLHCVVTIIYLVNEKKPLYFEPLEDHEVDVNVSIKQNVVKNVLDLSSII